jgi:branched-chain amino acid transport system substrate-binding protein
VCFDLDFGYEQCGGFVNSFTDAGGQIVKQLWHPIGEQNYSTIVSQVKNLKPDAVFVGNSGSDSVRFLQSWSDLGLKIPIITGEAMVDQSNLRSMTDSAVGIISAGHYAEGLDQPATKEFVDGFTAANGHMPSYFAASMYTAAAWIVKAIEATNGNVSDRDAFVKAIRAVNLDSSPLGGTMKLDEYNNTTMDIYIRKVAKNADGKLWNTVVKTYPSVSQFWTYDPQEYLKHPVYTKAYQGNGVWPAPTS